VTVKTSKSEDNGTGNTPDVDIDAGAGAAGAGIVDGGTGGPDLNTTDAGTGTTSAVVGSTQPDAKPDDVVLYLKGPHRKPTQARVDQLAFNVRGGPVYVPVGKNTSMSPSHAEAVKGIDLPDGYSWEEPEAESKE
jgi:hypothetical protein